MPSGGIRTHNLSRRAAENLHLRPRGHWDRRIPHVMSCYCFIAICSMYFAICEFTINYFTFFLIIRLFSCSVCFAFYFMCSVFLKFFCTVSLHVHSYLFSICAQFYTALPLGGNPLAVNKYIIYHIIYIFSHSKSPQFFI
jgi:hypothetical protein